MRLNLVQFPGLARIKEVSQKLGDSHVIIAQDFSAEELKKLRPQGAATEDPVYGQKTTFYFCKLLPNPDNAELQKTSKLADFTAITGNSIENCSFAARHGLDLTLNPFTPVRNLLDSQTAGVLAGNGTFIGIVFTDFLHAEGFARSQLLKNAAMAVKVAQSSGAKLLFFSGARNEFEMRAIKDLSSFGALLGMKSEDALRATRLHGAEFLGRLQ